MNEENFEEVFYVGSPPQLPTSVVQIESGSMKGTMGTEYGESRNSTLM